MDDLKRRWWTPGALVDAFVGLAVGVLVGALALLWAVDLLARVWVPVAITGGVVVVLAVVGTVAWRRWRRW